MSDTKECFVICPIGSADSETREHADKLIEYIIDEAVSEYGYEPVRADDMSGPGSISAQIIEKIIDTDLVIADLTNHNPNVFYELAVRHATAKPYIQLIEKSESIPFDISDIRTIKYGFDVEDVESAVNEIGEHIEEIEREDTTFETPISKSANIKSLGESEDPVQQSLADLLEGMSSLNRRLDDLEREVSDSPAKDSGKGTTEVPTISDAILNNYEVTEDEMEDLAEKVAKNI